MPITLYENILTLTDAIRLVSRRNGRRAHKSTLYRWTATGCSGIVLESIQCGGSRCTSREALERFFSRLSTASGRAIPNSPMTSTRRDHSSAVERELDESGF